MPHAYQYRYAVVQYAACLSVSLCCSAIWRMPISITVVVQYAACRIVVVRRTLPNWCHITGVTLHGAQGKITAVEDPLYTAQGLGVLYTAQGLGALYTAQGLGALYTAQGLGALYTAQGLGALYM